MICEIVERQEAKKRGLKRYFTGRACIRGHSAQRNVGTGKCIECRPPSSLKWREYNDRWKAKYPGREQTVKYRYRYGIELSEIPDKPDKCSICEQPHKKIVLDHCHETGKFRGWLCDPCNVVLGMVSDDTTILRKLIAYIEAAKKVAV